MGVVRSPSPNLECVSHSNIIGVTFPGQLTTASLLGLTHPHISALLEVQRLLWADLRTLRTNWCLSWGPVRTLYQKETYEMPVVLNDATIHNIL